jgi:hypothetical protein
VRSNSRSLTWETARPIFIIAAIAALLLSAMFGIRPAITAAFTPGENGHPNGGPYSDLKGGTANFTFETNAVLSCDSDNNATSFTFTVDYTVTNGPLPDGATLIIYLSPNNGAIQGNSNGDAAGYIADVESNWTPKDVSGLDGSGSFEVNLTITSPFQLSSGGVLGVFASENGGQSWTSKTNSLNCTEASQPGSVPESVPGSVAESVPPSVEGSVAASQSSQAASVTPEGSVKAGTGTPSGSVPNGSVGQNGVNPLPTVLFSLILLASLAGLAFANVKTARSRS